MTWTVLSAHRRHHISILWFCYAFGISIVLVRMYLNLFCVLRLGSLWFSKDDPYYPIWQSAFYEALQVTCLMKMEPFNVQYIHYFFEHWKEHFDIIVSKKQIKCSSIIAHSFELTLSEYCPKWTSYHLAIIYYA